MATEAEQIRSIRSLTLAQLEQLRADPKPTYSIDGQQVAWSDFIESLERTIDWCDRKLAGYEPFEYRSEGTTT